MKLNLVIGLLFAFNISAATYYIDFVGGSDSNSGTSKTTPWKRHPWMRGATVPGYSHQAGDRFAFKGGVSWPNAVLPMLVNARGASGSLMDYYGVDLTWFSGAVFTKPRFDAEDAETASGNRFIIGHDNDNYQIDNIEFTRMFWSGESRYSEDVIILVGAATNVTISNCIFTNWSHAPFDCAPGGTKASGLYCVIGNNNPPYNIGCIITNCVFDSGGRMADPGGQACYVWPNVFNSRAHRMANAFLTGYNSHVYGNVIGPMIVPGDCGYTHDNQIETVNGGSHYIHDNTMFGAGTVCVFVGGYGVMNMNYFWNNVAFDMPVNPFSLDNLAANPGGTCYIWNNTLVANASCVRLVSRGGASTLQKVVLQNNLWITDHVAPVSFEVPIITLVNDHNIRLTHAQAAAQGYTAANRYAPTAPGNSTVNAGTDAPKNYFTKDILGMSRGETWDVGAYELGVDVAVQPPRNLRRITDP